MQRTAWKRAERAEYGEPLNALAGELAGFGTDCVGMSSLGPTLFCFGDAVRLAEIARMADSLDCDVYRTLPSNAGRHVTECNA